MDRYLRWWTLIPLLLFAVWCGAQGLDADPIHQDEFFQIRDVRTTNDPVAMAIHVAAANPWHVPAYFVILNNWGRLFYWDPVPMRVMALFMGLLAVAFTYRLGRQHISRQVGWYAAAILASSAFFVYYWHEVRMYSMTALMAALVLWAYLTLLRARRLPNLWAWAGFYLAVMVALLTHYFMGIFLAGLGLYHLLLAPRSRRWWWLLLVFGLAAVSFAPWIGTLLKAADRTAGDIGGVLSNPEVISRIAYLYGNGQLAALAGLALLALIPLWTWRGLARRSLVAVWFVLVVNIGIALLANTLIGLLPAGRMRYVIYLWPLLSLVIAAGIANLGRLLPARSVWARAAPLLVLAAWAGFGFYRSATALTADNVLEFTPYFPVQQVFRDLKLIHRPGDYIVHVLPDADWPSRYNRSVPFYPEIIGLAADSGAIGADVNDNDESDTFDRVISQIGPARQYVWVAQPPEGSARLAELAAALTPTYGLCGVVITRPQFVVDEYAPSPVCCTPDAAAREPLARYGEALALMGVDLRPDVAAGALEWFMSFDGADMLPPETYSVAVHVIDASGALVAQADSGLPADAFACERHTLSIAGLPPGDYDVRLAVYNWQTGERLPAVLVESGEGGDMLTVGRFTIGG